MKRVIALVFFALTAAAPATTLTLLGGGSVSGASSSPQASGAAPTFDSNFTFGGGVSFTATGGSLLNLEIGALFMPRKYGLAPGADVTLNMLEFPVLVRFTFIPILSLGVGGYYALRLADSIAATAFNKSDFGVVGSIGADFPVGMAALVVEVRYLFGVSDMDPDPVGTFYTRNWQFLGGIRFGL